MAFSIAFNQVLKLASCSVAATDIAGAGFILTIPDAEEIAVIVIDERGTGKSDKSMAVSCGYWNC